MPPNRAHRKSEWALKSDESLSIYDQSISREETQKLAAMVKHEMEHLYELDVPLVADIGVGENWRDAK